MFTISDALKGSNVPPTRKTLADLKVGEAFKWVRSRDSGDVWCVRVGTVVGSVFKDVSATYWMPIEGQTAGYVFTDHTGKRETVYQP